MGEGHYIETDFDVLLSTLKDANKPLSAGRLASICGMREVEVVKWLHVLEKSGQVRLENRFNGIHASWAGAEEEKKTAPQVSSSAIDVGDVGGQAGFEADLTLAHQREDDASGKASRKKKGDVPAVQNGISVSSAIDVDDLRAEGPAHGIKPIRATREENTIDAIEREAMDSEETVATEISPKPDFEREPFTDGKEVAKDGVLELEEEARRLAPDADVREKWKAEQELDRAAAEKESEDASYEREGSAFARESEDGAARESKGEAPERIGEEETAPRARVRVPQKGVITPKFSRAGARPAKIAKMKKPAPVEISGVTLQFSERIERQMRRIERQAREIDSLRQEKEKLLNDHYLPLQNRLESELETISDRVMRVQGKVAGLQKNAADLPSKISSVEKVQVSSIKAHGEMRRAYDEACALLEESEKQLAEEREKMELILDQSREELARHSAMSGELHSTMERIGEMETEAARSVSTARAALAEQAERLASAESHANDLRALRGEIGEGIVEMKREVASAKRVLSDLERQMGQMRQIEEYTISIRKDYDEKMSDIDDYIRNGNREFETLRESVEANFVRRYLRELRALTESYSFEFNQARRMEGDIDTRIADERKKLESLFEEGKKISYLFETQSRAPENAGKFEEHAGTFNALSEISSNRSQVAQMIAQVIGGRTENLPMRARISATKGKAEEPEPIGITKIVDRAGAKKRNAKKAKRAARKKAKKKARRQN
ncbi:MAG: hypothetical protein WCY41_03265 [Candidatus Micrarchaeia archaeon]